MLKTACHEKIERMERALFGYDERKKGILNSANMVWTGSYRVCGVLIVCDGEREKHEWS